MKTERQVLIDARALIEAPNRWTKGSNARDRNHLPAEPVGPDACSFCAAGAVMRAAGVLTADDRVRGVFERLQDNIEAEGEGEFYWSLQRFNDAPEVSHADVLALFDRAIEGLPS